MIGNFELLLRLVISVILGGLIGIEREAANRPAGLRTHILVSVGSTLMMIISIYGFDGIGDPSRLAAQVVSGIGFLGAGTILRTGDTITGLTTAASLWVCAGIGLAIGSGYYLAALITAIVVLLSLISFGRIEDRIGRNKQRITIICDNKPGLIGSVGTLLGKNNILIKDVAIKKLGDRGSDENILEVVFTVSIPDSVDINEVIVSTYNIASILNVSYQGR